MNMRYGLMPVAHQVWYWAGVEGQKELEGGEGGEEQAPPGEALAASASTPAAPGGGAEAGEEQHGGPTAAAEAAAPAAGPGLLSRVAGEVLPGAGAAPCADECEEERATLS